MSYQITFGGFQHQGKRSYQEDRFLAESKLISGVNVYVLAVADGMGGHQAGDIAAEIAIAGIRQFYYNLNTTDFSDLKKKLDITYFEVNSTIREYASNNSETTGMGTTLTCAIIIGNKMIVAHIGDSRAYVVSEETIYQCTKDHSAYQEAIDSGINVKKINVGANALTRCLDGSSDYHPDLSPVYDVGKSLIFLCTDGLSGTLSDIELEQLARRSQDAKLFAVVSVEKAIKFKASDNVTVVSLAFPGRKVFKGAKRLIKKRSKTQKVLSTFLLLLFIAALGATAWAGYMYFDSERNESLTQNQNSDIDNSENEPEELSSIEDTAGNYIDHRDDPSSFVDGDLAEGAVAEALNDGNNNSTINNDPLPQSEEINEPVPQGNEEFAEVNEPNAEPNKDEEEERNTADDNDENQELNESNGEHDSEEQGEVESVNEDGPEQQPVTENGIDEISNETPADQQSGESEYGLKGNWNEELSESFCFRIGAYEAPENAESQYNIAVTGKYRVKKLKPDDSNLTSIFIGQYLTQEDAEKHRETIASAFCTDESKPCPDLVKCPSP